LVEFEQVVLSKFEPALPIDKIDIADENVRKSRQKAGLEELKQSIVKLGLIHPVIVIKVKDRYSLVSGQRRYLAFVDLKRTTIPALIIDPVDSITQEMISFSENIHRKALPYDDTIRVCGELFDRYSGPQSKRIERIAKDLGISPGTVTKYLSYRLVPAEVQQLVTEGKLTPTLAYRITTSFWPNVAKITAIAKEVTRMTKPEWERLLDVGRREPQSPVQEIVRRAKIPERKFVISVPIDQEQQVLLERMANKRQTDVVSMVRSLIEDLIKEESEAQ
jgi:ParB/RepB/Spo0J family partition protein